MAITRTQIARQLYQFGGGADMGKEKGPETGRAARDDRQASENRVSAATDIKSMQQAFGPSIGPKTKDQQDARDRIEDQRRRARYAITPSTNPRNRIISALASSFVPFGGLLFNKAIDRTAMGFNTPPITEEEDDEFEDRDRGDGQPFIPNMMATPFQQDVIQKTTEELSPIELAIQQRDALFGPRAFAKEGGIMDLETGRQMYFLGKLVKKVTRSVKKIAKSPIGKAALGAAALYGGKKLGLGSIAKNFFTDKALPFIKDKDNLPLLLGAGLTAAPLLFQQDDSDDEYQKFLASRGSLGQGLDIQGIRNDPYSYLGRAFVAEGGKPEPVAKKTMPLLDMGGMEKDYRKDGGFVPIGRMEKADDVPARLSKNEFVFTADAVRNAGDGNVDKGAEVMYNMMKNLEAGGDVSEESQGLKGARRMFQTSQRLEEVL